jgi:7-keto-8-aminopelargonate synthetase-like enzyme
MVDDSHATGFVGPNGRGTHEHAGVMERVDVLTGTLGKALGGASGGYASGRREIIAFLRQRSRPYLFSNTVPPAVLAGALKAIELVEREPALRARLWENTRYFRNGIASCGFAVAPGNHPIVPIMIGDAGLPTAWRAPAGEGDLRGRICLSRGPEGEGPNPRPDERRPRTRGSGPRPPRLRRGHDLNSRS